MIDLAMGNPSEPTSDEIVEKPAEAARGPRNQRYGKSAGIYNLRREVARKYERGWGVELELDRPLNR